MSADIWILVGVATVGVAAVVGALVVAVRRRGSEPFAPEVATPVRERELVSVAVPAEGPTEETPPGPPVDDTPTQIEVREVARVVEVSPEQAGVTRRQFFNRALGATFATFLTGFGLASLSFLWPKLTGGFGSDVNAGKVDELLKKTVNDDGTITPVYLPEAKAYVVPAPDPLPAIYEGKNVVAGGVFALYQRCTHLGCRVPWCGASQGFECPCHGSKYSVIGEYFTGPAPRSLDRFVVELNDAGELIIKTGQIVQTPRLDRLNVPYPQGPSCIDI